MPTDAEIIREALAVLERGDLQERFAAMRQPAVITQAPTQPTVVIQNATLPESFGTLDSSNINLTIDTEPIAKAIRENQPNIIVNVPPQPAPIVNVAPAPVKFDIPPIVIPAPVVNLPAPEVTANVIMPPTEETMEVERGQDGMMKRIRKVTRRKYEG